MLERKKKRKKKKKEADIQIKALYITAETSSKLTECVLTGESVGDTSHEPYSLLFHLLTVLVQGNTVQDVALQAII